MSEADKYWVEKWLAFNPVGNNGLERIPSVIELWSAAQDFLKDGNAVKANQCELLIRLLHNSYVSKDLRLGENVDFAYGGIGLVIHKDAEIGSNVMIGQGVTIGGAPGISRIDAATGNSVSYPKINDFVYISAGARIIGGIEVGSFSIVGANAVLKRNIPPFSVCVGVPVREPRAIEPKDFAKYKGYWAVTKQMDTAQYLEFIAREYQQLVVENRKKYLEEFNAPAVISPITMEAWESLESDGHLEEVMKNCLAMISEDFSSSYNSPTYDKDGAIIVKLPYTGASFTIPANGDVNWFPRFESNTATNNAFFYSLQWVGEWLSSYEKNKDINALAACAHVLESYLYCFSEDEKLKNLLEIRSSDHSIAIRIRVLVKFLYLSGALASPSKSLQKSILRHLLVLAEWSISERNFRENNHGLMSCIAVLHVAAQMRHFATMSAYFETVAGNRILKMAAAAFDKDGYCNENTIGYHRFNASLYESVRGFCDTHGVATHLVRELADVVEKAKTALRYSVWQDGSIPPIGDSPFYEHVCSSINKSKWFSESGFLVVKNDDLYLSVICGSRSHIHKQCDDSSITLRYRNRSVLIDAGHYTHDETDPYRLALAGQRGHCGIYLEEFDNQLPESFIRTAAPYKAVISDFTEDGDSVIIRCNYSLQSGRFLVSRVIMIFWPDEILVRDQVVSTALEPVTARQRFVFDPEVVARRGTSRIDLCGEGIAATMFHLSPSLNDTYAATAPPAARGWCSFRFSEILPTWGVDFVQRGAEIQFTTVIKLSAIDNIDQLSDGLRSHLGN